MPSKTSTPGDIGERLTVALAATWRAIQHHHPDIPPVILTLGADTPSQCGSQLGHFTRNRWHHGQNQDAELHELFISGEGLRTGAGSVLATLLHQAAHALATARGITDTSNRGYYHNKRYKELAEELGLTVTDAGPRGWRNTTPPTHHRTHLHPPTPPTHHSTHHLPPHPNTTHTHSQNPQQSRSRMPMPPTHLGRPHHPHPSPHPLREMRQALFLQRYQPRRLETGQAGELP